MGEGEQEEVGIALEHSSRVNLLFLALSLPLSLSPSLLLSPPLRAVKVSSLVIKILIQINGPKTLKYTQGQNIL